MRAGRQQLVHLIRLGAIIALAAFLVGHMKQAAARDGSGTDAFRAGAVPHAIQERG